MILRNRSSTEQILLDHGALKCVGPDSLVQVSEDVGFAALTNAPQVWTAEAAIVPPAPSPSRVAKR